ncbi:MAG TPA: hypothetical protein DCO83_15950 [Mucilaginibacter sp.]|nr:hypothetical protein [Mucilaginibacter sp.]
MLSYPFYAILNGIKKIQSILTFWKQANYNKFSLKTFILSCLFFILFFFKKMCKKIQVQL